VLEGFFTAPEVYEMQKAGRALCSQAPKEDRKVFQDQVGRREKKKKYFPYVYMLTHIFFHL
jgi:hypothetical protein